jgi:hypothetical protein
VTAPHYVTVALRLIAAAPLIVLLAVLLFWAWAHMRNSWLGPRMKVTEDFARRLRPGDRFVVGSGVVEVRRVEGAVVFYDLLAGGRR